MSRGQTNDGFERSHCDGTRHFVLIVVGGFASDERVQSGSVLDAILLELWVLLGFDKREEFLQKLSCKHVSLDSTSDLDQVLLVDLLLVVSILVKLEIRLNDAVFVHVVEKRTDITLVILEPVVRDNSLSDLSVDLGILLVEHDED